MKLASLTLFLTSFFFSFAAVAQVTPDGTTSTTVTPTPTGVQINNGNRNGGNLFHSFGDFSVSTGSEAYFNNANDIVNIFSRVTGGNISNIDGILRANGTANLFLINPAGILFGENARLQLGGSFYGSTADSIVFPDGEFSATDLENPPLITINAPIGLNFRDNPADITIRGNGNGARLTDEVIDTQEALRVGADSTIGLIGGNLIFEDASIKTAGGRIELGSVAGGDVDLVEVANGFTVDYSGVENFQDISLTGSSNIDASGLGSGDIHVVGRNITIKDISGIEANTLGGESAGDINVNASESIEISGVENESNFVSAISNRVFSQGTADGGDINIETGNLIIGDRVLISTFLFGQGDAGDININATESVSLVSQGNTSGIASAMNSGARGNSGDINITTPVLTLSDGAFLSSNTSGIGDAGDINVSGNSLSLENGSSFIANANSSQGNAGNITVNAAETVFLDGSGFYTNVRTAETIGNGGEINITTGSLTMSNGATLDAATAGQGNAGNITLDVRENITIEGNPDSLIFIATNVLTTGVGNAGDITINADSINFNNASLFANNSSQGSAGNVNLSASNDVSFANNSIIFATGADGGSISIEAKNLELTSGSSLSGGIGIDSGSSEAQAGDIIINLTEDLLIDGAGSETLTQIANQNFGTGNAGNVSISARNINFLNGGNIFNTNNGAGNLGDVTIIATGNVNFDGFKGFSRTGISNQVISYEVNEVATGDVGKIDITAQNLTLTNGSQINSIVGGNADSGNINLNVADTTRVDGTTEEIIFDDGTSSILPSNISTTVANIGNGNSGDININTQNLFLSRNGKIEASVFGIGSAGDININSQIITIGQQGNATISPSGISSQVLNGSSPLLEEIDVDVNQIKAGDITVNTNSLSITDGTEINAGIAPDSIGNGGDITINATESIAVDGTGLLDNAEQGRFEIVSEISSDILSGGLGNSGNITLNTPNLSVSNSAFISADTLGKGNSGNITIGSEQSPTEKVTLTEGGFISASTFAEGNAGNLTIYANEIDITGIGKDNSSSGLLATVGSDATGNGGNLFIQAENIRIEDDGLISVSTFAKGDTGFVKINASESLELLNAGQIQADVREGGIGDSNDVTIETAKLKLTDGAQISASTLSDGNGGDLTVSATDYILISGQRSNGSRSALLTNATIGKGNGGDLSIFTEQLILRDSGTVGASNFSTSGLLEPGSGNSGNLNIDADFIIAFPNQNSDIVANARQGDGGNININAEAVLGLEERKSQPENSTNDIDASSQFGLAGNISINTPDTNSLRENIEQAENVVTSTVETADSCSVSETGEIQTSGGLVVKGKGGVPPLPTEPFDGETIIVDGEATSDVSQNNNVGTFHGTSLQGGNDSNLNIEAIPPYIQPVAYDDNGEPMYLARGVIVQEDGTVILTAYPTKDTQARTPENPYGCGK
jgi:filamentous hemagglutinin family protein